MTAARADTRPLVLVVEDEALVALLVADTLAEAGYRVVRAPGGRGASPDRKTGAVPDAAVVNLRLADGLDGRDIIRALRRRRQDLPVVVITGYDPQAPQADLRGLGGPTVRLGKPFDCDELLERLARLLARPSPLRAPRRRGSDMAA
jgi:DNA-binding response OmpR family regulator